MIWLDFLLPATCLLGGANAHAIRRDVIPLEERGVVGDAFESVTQYFETDNTKSYAPYSVKCPSSNNLVRKGDDLSKEEKDWLKGRKSETQSALKDFLTRANMKGFDPDGYLKENTPIVGLAFSGGGYRAMLNGAGILSAWDSRTKGATDEGGVGGLLQSATYMAGLSGGSWLVGTITMNNFTSVQDILKDGRLWNLEDSIYDPDGGIVTKTNYFGDLVSQVDAKEDAGYPITLTDYWGSALSRQLIDLENGGPGLKFSDAANFVPFKDHKMPFPMIVADSRRPEEKTVDIGNTIYVFNPYEFGSHDPNMRAFFPTKYVGSDVNNGKPKDSNACVNGLDNAGYVMGTSASLFNMALMSLNSSGLNDYLYRAVNKVLTKMSTSETDIAKWYMNPFYGVNPDTNEFAKDKNLILVDGGEDLQNIPLNPLIQNNRNVDVIFAVDSSADVVHDNGDTVNWPNGTALVATYERSLTKMANGTSFPYIPDTNTFVNNGLNKQPTFFGCSATNYSDSTSSAKDAGPLVVYIPNAPYTYFSNASTYTMEYKDSERNGMIENGYNIATLANGTVDKDWAACMGCAIIQRSVERNGEKQTDQCKQCFERYCWDGKRNSTKPKETYQPALFIRSKSSSAVRILGSGMSVVGLSVAWAAMYAAGVIVL